jgi:hypothetical protein
MAKDVRARVAPAEAAAVVAKVEKDVTNAFALARRIFGAFAPPQEDPPPPAPRARARADAPRTKPAASQEVIDVQAEVVDDASTPRFPKNR